MTDVLPQQKLLLELLAMAGDVAIPDSAEDTIIWRTLAGMQKGGLVDNPHHQPRRERRQYHAGGPQAGVLG